ncbi:MAG: hypothetical protein ACAI38_06475 [Myxococcota bacterium]
MFHRRLALVALLATLVPACKDDPKDEVEIVPFRSTRILGEADLALLEPDAGDGVLRFTSMPAGLANVQRGQVIVASKSPTTPTGLLRIVKSAAADGDGLRLETVHAPIQLAFQKIHIKTTTKSTGELGTTAWPNSTTQPLSAQDFDRHVGATQNVNMVVFDGDGDTETENDQVVLEGDLGGAIDFSFRLDFDWGALEDLPDLVEQCIGNLLEGDFSCSLTDLLPEAKAIFDAKPSLAANLDLHGAAILSFEKEFVLYKSNIGELVYPPVVITPHVEIVAKVEGAASAAFRTSANTAISFDTSVTLSSKQPGTPQFKPPELDEVALNAEPPEITLRASAKAGLGAELSTLIYGISGPYLTARAFAAVDADAFREPCVTLSAGVEGSLGVKITTPAFLFIDPFEIISWETELGPVEKVLDVPVPLCEPAPNASTLPPGSGPDAERLANPTFTAWSRTYAAPMSTLATIGGGTSFWLDQQRSIDGRMVIAARGAEALIKIDEDGALVWNRALSVDADEGFGVLHPVRVLSTPDAGLLVLAEPRVPPLSIVKLTQAGRVEFRRELILPDPTCFETPVGLASDGGSGSYVVLACGSLRVFIVHLNAAGEVLDASSFTDATATQLNPALVTNARGDLFISGRISQPMDSMFALRRDGQGNVLFANRYEACPAGPDVYPVSAVIEDNGDVTVAGRGGAEHNGFLARLKTDGDVGFAAFPGFGFGAGSVFALDAIAELPTTGYIVSGYAVRFTADPPADAVGLALLQLDAVGQPLWSRRYLLAGAGGEPGRVGQTDLRLTDDGGVLVTAATQLDPLVATASLWAMKVPAKDGLIDLGIAGTSFADDVVALPCSLTSLPWNVTLQSESGVTTRVVPTDTVPFAMTVQTQGP